MYLSGKRILVTGAASGIGRKTTELLDSLGAQVLLLDRNEEELLKTKKSMKNAESKCCVMDLIDVEKIESKIKTLLKETGPIDGFVHCAGISDNRPLSMYKYEILHHVMLVNFYSFFELVRVITRKGNYSDNGMNIVAISSVAAKAGGDAQTAYGASKAAMNGAMHSMAKELASKKIRINTILPAAVNTPMIQKYLDLKQTLDSNPGKTNSRQILGMCQPEYVARVIAFLLSEDSIWITGVELPVDGGYLS